LLIGQPTLDALPPGASPLSTYRITVGWWVIAAIVALRVGIGLHFYLEGTAKLRDPKPFSGAFFANAKGPFAPFYKRLVWDVDGKYRLDYGLTAKYWAGYRDQVASHFHFDDSQKKKAEKIVKDHTGRLNWYLNSKEEDIDEYLKQVERRKRNQADVARSGLESMRAHDARIETELNAKKMPMLAAIDKVWKDLEDDLNALATKEQYTRHGRLAIGKVGRAFPDSELMDAVVPYFDALIGLLLILGLFTRFAAIAGGLFLASVCASQWPGYGGIPIYYQFVEMLALFALAAIGAGQFCGLDYVISGVRRLYKKPATIPARAAPSAASRSVLVAEKTGVPAAKNTGAKA
jgi:uncharacterized membrane protein YphA (DoxX/SURF4 family)